MRVRLHYQINTSHFSYLFLLLSCVHTGSTSLIEHCFVVDVSWPFPLWLPTTPPPDCECCCLSPAPPQPEELLLLTQAPQQRDTGIMTPLSRAASVQAPPTTDTFPTADLQGRIHHEESLRTFSFIFPLWNSHLSFLKFKFCYDKMSVKKKAALVISWQKSFSIMAPWRKGKVSFFPLIKSWSLRNGSVVVYTVMSVTFVSQLFLFFSVLNLEQQMCELLFYKIKSWCQFPCFCLWYLCNY